MWKFYQPANVIFGEGELANLGKYMDERHLNRAFMVADAFLVIPAQRQRLRSMQPER